MSTVVAVCVVNGAILVVHMRLQSGNAAKEIMISASTGLLLRGDELFLSKRDAG